MAVTRRRPAAGGQGKGAPSLLVLPSTAASTARTLACLALHLVVRAFRVCVSRLLLWHTRRHLKEDTDSTLPALPPSLAVLRRVRPDHRVALLLTRRKHAAGIHRLWPLLPGALRLVEALRASCSPYSLTCLPTNLLGPAQYLTFCGFMAQLLLWPLAVVADLVRRRPHSPAHCSHPPFRP